MIAKQLRLTLHHVRGIPSVEFLAGEACSRNTVFDDKRQFNIFFFYCLEI
jgi:hypothetical protein